MGGRPAEVDLGRRRTAETLVRAEVRVVDEAQRTAIPIAALQGVTRGAFHGDPVDLTLAAAAGDWAACCSMAAAPFLEPRRVTRCPRPRNPSLVAMPAVITGRTSGP